MKNKRVKQMICDAIVNNNDHIKKAWFGGQHQYPRHALSKKCGKVQFLDLHMLYKSGDFEFCGLLVEGSVTSLTANQLNNRG